MTGKVSQALGLGSVADGETLLQVVWRNRLVVKDYAHRNNSALAFIQGNAIARFVDAGCASLAIVVRILFCVAMRCGEFRIRSVGAPTLRLQTIVLERMVEPDKTGRDLSYRILDQLFVNLDLIFSSDDFIVRLVNLLSCRGIIKELGWQNFVGDSSHDCAYAIRPARSPHYITLLVQRFEGNESAPESYAGWHSVTGKILDFNARLEKTRGPNQRRDRNFRRLFGCEFAA